MWACLGMCTVGPCLGTEKRTVCGQWSRLLEAWSHARACMRCAAAGGHQEPPHCEQAAGHQGEIARGEAGSRHVRVGHRGRLKAGARRAGKPCGSRPSARARRPLESLADPPCQNRPSGDAREESAPRPPCRIRHEGSPARRRGCR